MSEEQGSQPESVTETGPGRPKSRKNIAGWILWLLQAAVSAVFAVMMIRSGFVPGRYAAAVAAALLVLLAVTFMLARSRRAFSCILGLILSVVACGLLIFGFVYLHRIDTVISDISGRDEQTDVIIVAVRRDDTAQSVTDLGGYRFGIYNGTNEAYINETAADVAGRLGESSLETVSYDSPLRMAQALLDGGVDAVICNQAYTDILDDSISGYSSQIRVIYQKEFVREAQSGRNSGEGESVSPQSDAVREESGETAENSGGDIDLTRNSFQVLISGIDVSGPISTTSRSDVNIIMTVNPVSRRILLTTTPRDYYVVIPEISGQKRDKLTHSGIYGVNATVNTLENLYGTDIDYYVRINFDSLIGMVDALGGIDVSSEYDFTTSGGFHFTKGVNHMDGDQALAFSRERYSFADGDNQRGRDQLLVLTAILEKLQSPAILQDPGEVLNVISTSMQTNVSGSQIEKFIAWQLAGGGSWDIERQAVTGEGGSEETYSMPGTLLYVMWPDEELVKQAAGKMREVYGGQ